MTIDQNYNTVKYIFAFSIYYHWYQHEDIQNSNT